MSFFFFLKKKSLVVLEYIQCPAIVLLCVSLMYVMWFVSHRQKMYCNISSVSCLSHIPLILPG